MIHRLRAVVSIFLASVILAVGCSVSVPEKNQLSEVEKLYDQQQYKNAMNVARFNLGKDGGDLASITTVWKVQLIQGGKTIDYAQQFYFQAQEMIKKTGPELVPYMGLTLLKDPYNTVRLFALYALAEFNDSLSTDYLARVFEPDYALGLKSSDVTLEFLKSEAVQVLSGRGYEGIFDDAVELAKSSDPDIMAKAVSALGAIGGQKALPILEEISSRAHSNSETDWVGEIADSTVAKIKRGE
jgi:hypothetical protein